MSDRSGRRKPFIAGSAAVMALAAAILAASPTWHVALVVAPLVAGVVLGLMNSYPALFALAGVAPVIAGMTVTRVRSVP